MAQTGYYSLSVAHLVGNHGTVHDFEPNPFHHDTYASGLKELTEKAQHIVILTGWKQFIEKRDMTQKKNVFDYR